MAACDDGFVRVYDVGAVRASPRVALGERVWWAGFQRHADVVVVATAGALSVYGLDDGAPRRRVRGFDDRRTTWCSTSRGARPLRSGADLGVRTSAPFVASAG